MIVNATDTALPHMFLRGFRAPVGQAATYQPGTDIVSFQEVGSFIARARLGLDGAPRDPGEVATEDEAYDGMPESGPFRYEADISVWKAAPDVVVVDDILAIPAVVNDPSLTPLPPAPYDADLAADIDAVLTTASFGTVEIDRGAGFGPAQAVAFGWQSRGTGGRLALAGDATTNDPWRLNEFDGARYKLPDGYDNGFQNGRPLSGQTAFAPGNRLRLTDTTVPLPHPVTLLTIPTAPVLSVTKEGAPLDPPLSLTPLVDTVVMDRGRQEFTLIWRVTFAWEDRFEDATLEVS
ncbi:hypothetical protein JJJ17_11190 [Paracoccus caeni]|uniref:DUF2169 domain-containing protein n=1 Tax=Paracoccus caeni TaxID=657651 RepID=A0A934SGB0_9RHOB|nr:hypothetical protein [Paracoccus caeni]MBK4216491.1 hypothetical protein [Paracoccus caeni]